MLCSLTARATTWYVATNGNDSYTTNQAQNPATPYLTIQKASSVAWAGDTIKAAQGVYGENVTATRSGTPASPIIFDGQGVAQVWSFNITKSNVYFVNWTIAGKASGWWFWMGKGGHGTVVSNCVFDGAYNTNMTYLMIWENPYQGTETPWGTNCASGCTIISNTFMRQVGGCNITIFGDTNLIYGNRLIDGDACDWFRVWGRTNIIANNVCSNGIQTGIKSEHPDFIQVFGANMVGSIGHIIENNLVINCWGDCQLLMTAGAITNGQLIEDWTFRNNKFVNISRQGAVSIPKIKFYNNLFYRCATNAGGNYPLIFCYNTNTTYTNLAWCAGHGGEVINNVFVDCGGTSTHKQGYWFYNYITNNPRADYNFVCYTNGAITNNPLHQAVGDPGGWDGYTWWEPNGINGGDPLFANKALFDFTIPTNSPLYLKGTNFSALFTNDFAGTTRPASGNWTIGPYESGNPSVYTVPDLPCAVDPKATRAISVIQGDTMSIKWPTNQYRTILTISRRDYTNRPSAWASWTNLYSITNGTVTSQGEYNDATISVGKAYEYEIGTMMTNWDCSGTSNAPAWSYQYIATGIEIPLRDQHGNVVLLVASNLMDSLSNELATLESDLIGDGYKVFRHNMATSHVSLCSAWYTQVTNTKAVIRSDWLTDTNADWTLFIVGQVPVPYSGLSSPGAHTNNWGAHPADWYYADMTEANWTDSTANDVTAVNWTNLTTMTYYIETNCWNVPGDGKFDQSTVPAIPTMYLGRVSLVNMPAYASTESQLLQQYLNRDHQWRHKQFTVNQTAMVISNGLPYDSHSLYSSFFGSGSNVILTNWIMHATNTANSCMFAASWGSGEHDRIDAIGMTTNFAKVSLYVPFCEAYGSYFGDWDNSVNSNSVLQAPLCNGGYGLESYYNAGKVNVNPSEIGEPYGYQAYVLAANFVKGTPTWYKSFGTTAGYNVETIKNYISLMGDPTIRLHIVVPPTNVVISTNGSDKIVSWTNSTDFSVLGYHVYRAPTTNLNSLTKLTTVLTNSPYTNSGAAATAYTYMVRAVKLENSYNRSYYNASQGAFGNDGSGGGGGGPTNAPGTATAVSVRVGRIIHP